MNDASPGRAFTQTTYQKRLLTIEAGIERLQAEMLHQNYV